LFAVALLHIIVPCWLHLQWFMCWSNWRTWSDT